MSEYAREPASEKSYGTAVILCGIFGVLGVHHFYLGNFMHGLIDLGMFILFVLLFLGNQPDLGAVVLIADAIHTIVVFYLLITEQQRDGLGLLVKVK